MQSCLTSWSRRSNEVCVAGTADRRPSIVGGIHEEQLIMSYNTIMNMDEVLIKDIEYVIIIFGKEGFSCEDLS